MILELLFFVVATVIAIKAISELRRPGGAKAVTKDKRSPQLAQLETYASRLYAERNWLAAEKAYLKVLKLNHKDPEAYSHLGTIYLALKKFEDSIECYQIAAQLKPNAGDWFNLGLAYCENANYIKSIAAIEKAIMFEPSAYRYAGLAKVYIKIANYAKAISSLEKAASLDPNNKKVLSLLADAYAKNHDREKAIEVYQRVLKLDPSDAKARRLVGSNKKKSQPA
jgi:tetratricopeptide (TPR) repeat protein